LKPSRTRLVYGMPSKTLYYTHINRGVIDSNRKNGTENPPIKFQRGKTGKATYAMEVALPANSKVIYDSKGRILACGARLVIISEEAPTVVK
jgi:hypothetical protein